MNAEQRQGRHLDPVCGRAALLPVILNQLIGRQAEELRVVSDKATGIHIARQLLEIAIFKRLKIARQDTGTGGCLGERKPARFTRFAKPHA